MQVDELKQ
jgi:hypothetical protein